MNRRDTFLALLALGAAPTAYSQTPATAPRIVLVDTAAATADMAEGRHPLWGTLLAELRRLDYVEGQNIAVERWSGGGAASAAAYRELARKVVASQPRLIVVRSRTALRPIAAETRKLPIVAIGSIPPDLFTNYARPGGNVTGILVSFDAQLLYGKQVEVLRNVLKPGARIAWLGPKLLWESVSAEAARKGAEAVKITLQPVFVASPVNKPAIRRAFAEIAESNFDAVLISPATELFPYRDSIAELAAGQKLPSLGNGRYWAEAGALLGYGIDLERVWRRAASYVDKVLKGTDPAVIPIEQPDKVELVINLETAKSVGVAIPQSMLLRADRVIE